MKVGEFTSLLEKGERSEKISRGEEKTGGETFSSIILEKGTEIFMIEKSFAKLITVKTK